MQAQKLYKINKQKHKIIDKMSKNLEEPIDEKESEDLIAKAEAQIRISEEKCQKLRSSVANMKVKLSVYRKLKEK